MYKKIKIFASVSAVVTTIHVHVIN